MSQYDKFAKEYIAMRSNMFEKNINAEFPMMLQLLWNIKGKKLLDLGCGFGDYAKVYSEKGAIVMAVDNSEKEIEHAQKLHKDLKEKINNIPVQGGLDPKILLGDKEKIKKYTEIYLSIFKDYPYIFNLGHGVLPETKPETIEYIIQIIRNKK